MRSLRSVQGHWMRLQRGHELKVLVDVCIFGGYSDGLYQGTHRSHQKLGENPSNQTPFL